ncbi:MAG: Lrp/AsnC family transcriptional regulator [Candidatus Hermodarchaeota archaeon]
MAKLKPADMQIVQMLLQNSRTRLNVLSEKVGLHPSTVAYRIKKLRAMGIIRKFTISVDWRKLGKTVEVAVLINCSPRNVSTLAKILAKFDEVIEVHSLAGSYNLLLMVTLRDMQEYKEFIEKKLGGMPEIENIHSGIVLEDFKEE